MFLIVIAKIKDRDWIDVLLQIGSVATFVAFGIAMLLIKRGQSKKPTQKDPTDGAS